MQKVDWDTYFITQCFLVSMRSIDPSTKHGCVIVDEYKRILATGYNGPIAGIDDSSVPLTRPEKYPFLPHAEENALLSLQYAKVPNATLYVTGKPCHKCLRMILQKGIRKIVYGPQNSAMYDETEKNICDKMIKDTNCEYIEFTNKDAFQRLYSDFHTRVSDHFVKQWEFQK